MPFWRSAPYSDHILDVLAALSRRIAVPTTATPHPDPPTVTDSDHFPATAADTAPSLGANETKRCHVSYARAVSAETSVLAPQPETSQPDIVIRFADAPDGPPRRATPGGIFTALHDALSLPTIEPGTGTTSFMIEKYALRIWEIIRPMLHFPDDHPPPAFESSDPWHSVVFHNVLALAQRASYTIPAVQYSLGLGGYHHTVKAISVLCTDEELARRHENGTRVSLRVTVETKEAAQKLVDLGGMIMGGRLKAYHYAPRARSPATHAESLPT
ncbi:hypothetical protein MSAN_01484200 [Mycena sanguinolenta]|uniref:Uncharacterized protein n=1 Tax=Mycena sanguinolenta TaxID=230812 RepID=A0A8H6YAZ0_9AGAR|nr:hypothetical protein MSAN_01484200 [Mycena sanguinolenta]